MNAEMRRSMGDIRHKHSEIAGTAVSALQKLEELSASATSTLKSRGLRCKFVGLEHAEMNRHKHSEIAGTAVVARVEDRVVGDPPQAL